MATARRGRQAGARAPSHGDARPFLSIVSWPEGWSREAIADLLARTGALDRATSRLRLGQDPPMVAGQVGAESGRDAVESLVARGGDAFLFTFRDLAALGGTLEIRDLAVKEGRLEVELRAGPTTSIAPASIRLLVRAQVRRPTREARDPLRFADIVREARVYGSLAALGRGVHTSDRLDIHAAERSVYQVNGDRFGYRALGDLRGPSDTVNVDLMCDLLHHLAPHAIVDSFFSLWRPPSGFERLDLPRAGTWEEDASFAFYSRWMALVYRHVAGA